MKRNRTCKGLSLVLAAMLLVMTGCGTKVTIPDEYDYDLSEYIKLGEYKGIEYDKVSVTVSQGDVEEYIKSVLEQSKTTETVKSGTVDESSIADIYYKGYIDGVAFEGGEGSASLDIDNSTFIEGFAEALVGHSVGENFDINVKFPDDYASTDIAGKPAVFNITINSLQKETLPEYNDDFVKANTDFSNTRDYEEDIRNNLKSEKERTANNEVMRDVFNKIADKCELLKVPETEFNSRYNNIVDSYTGAAAGAGVSLEDYLSKAMGMTVEDFEAQAKKQAQATVKQELILHAIAEAEGIKISEGEYGDYLTKLIEDAGYTQDSFKSETGMTVEDYASANNLYSSCLRDKVMEKVMEYCVN